MSQDKSFRHETVQDPDSIKRYFEAFVAGFQSGELRLSSKGREVILTPNGLIKFDVEAKSKDNRCKLILKFSWKEHEDSELDDGALVIEPR